MRTTILLLFATILVAGCEKPVAQKQYTFEPSPVVKPTPTPTQVQTKSGITIRPEKIHAVGAIAAQIRRSRNRYETVSASTGVPWPVIASLHYRESDLDFRTNLANGDPLSAKTRHVPKGLPIHCGNAPYDWNCASVDALKYDKLDKENWGTQEHTLNNCEAYNGTGYARMGVPSPYVWSWTNKYLRGKYIADGVYSPTAIDQQCGVYPILSTL